MAKIEEICKHCAFWLASDRITDYGYCVKRDAYKPEFLTCDHFIVKDVLRVDAIVDAIMEGEE